MKRLIMLYDINKLLDESKIDFTDPPKKIDPIDPTKKIDPPKKIDPTKEIYFRPLPKRKTSINRCAANRQTDTRLKTVEINLKFSIQVFRRYKDIFVKSDLKNGDYIKMYSEKQKRFITVEYDEDKHKDKSNFTLYLKKFE